jgi:hypothetical protein
MSVVQLFMHRLDWGERVIHLEELGTGTTMHDTIIEIKLPHDRTQNHAT